MPAWLPNGWVLRRLTWMASSAAAPAEAPGKQRAAFRGSSRRGEAGAASPPGALTEPEGSGSGGGRPLPAAAAAPRLPWARRGARQGRARRYLPGCPPGARSRARSSGPWRRAAGRAAGRGERGGCGGGGARLSLALLVVTARQARIPSGSRSLSPFCFSTIELRWKQKIEGV